MSDTFEQIYPPGRPMNRYQFARHCPNTFNAAAWRLGVVGRRFRIVVTGEMRRLAARLLKKQAKSA